MALRKNGGYFVSPKSPLGAGDHMRLVEVCSDGVPREDAGSFGRKAHVTAGLPRSSQGRGDVATQGRW